MKNVATSVEVDGKSVIFRVSDGDLKKAVECLEKNGELKFHYSELVVRDFPTDMSFVIKNPGLLDGGDGGGDGGSDGGGGGYDID